MKNLVTEEHIPNEEIHFPYAAFLYAQIYMKNSQNDDMLTKVKKIFDRLTLVKILVDKKTRTGKEK